MNRLEELQQDDNLTPFERFEKLVRGVLEVSKEELDERVAKKKAEKDKAKEAKQTK